MIINDIVSLLGHLAQLTKSINQLAQRSSQEGVRAMVCVDFGGETE